MQINNSISLPEKNISIVTSISESLWAILPKDIQVNVLSYLPILDIASCSLVSKEWHQLANDNSLWRLLLKRDFSRFTKKVGIKPAENAKQVYQNYRFRTNITKGLYATTTIHNPGGGVSFKSIVSKEGLLVSGDYFGQIIIWDLKKEAQEVYFKQAHTKRIGALAFTNEGHLISASIEGEIKIWDLKTGDCLNTFQEYPGDDIHLVATKENLLISGSSGNEMIKIWDLTTKQCVAHLQEHTEGITALILTKEDLLISSSSDGTIKKWDLKGLCLQTIPKTDRYTTCLVLNEKENQLISGDTAGNIKVWDLNTFVCIHFCENGKDRNCDKLSSLHVIEENYLMANCQSGFKIWDVKNTKNFITLKWLRESSPWSFKFKDGLLFFKEGKLFVSPARFQVLDFKASDKAIFKELANTFKKGVPHECKEAFERLLRMPTKAKKKIFHELYEIQKDLISMDFFQNGKEAMELADPRQIAQVIDNYLKT